MIGRELEISPKAIIFQGPGKNFGRTVYLLFCNTKIPVPQNDTTDS
jgi:hypothetical protein